MSRANGGGDFREGAKLLTNSGSDSDVQEFSLPPLKGSTKKSRKKKTLSYATSAGEGCCSTSVLVVSVLFAVVIAAQGLLAVMYYKLYIEFQEVKMKFDENQAVETGDQGSSAQFQKLHTDFKFLSEKLQKLETDGKQHTKNFININNEIKNLKSTAQSLQSSVAKAPTLQNVPAQVDSLSKTVASMGSEMKTLQNFQSQYTKDHENINKRLTALESQAAHSQADSGRESPSPNAVNKHLSEEISRLSTAIDQVNSTMLDNTKSLLTNIRQQELNVMRLQNKTNEINLHLQLLDANQQPSANKTDESPDWQALVKDAISSAMDTFQAKQKNASQAVSPSETEAEVPESSEQIDQLIAQVTNISSFVQTFKKDFEQFKNERENDLNDNLINLNTTDGMTSIMKSAFEAYNERYGLQIKWINATLKDLNSTVEELKTDEEEQENKIEGLDQDIRLLMTTVAQIAKQNTTVVSPTQTVGSVPETKNKQIELDHHEEEEEGHHVDTMNFVIKKLVPIPGYANKKNLETGFSRWDKDGDGFALYDDMVDFIGPAIPKLEDLKQYDLDKDGKFTLAELKSAAGLNPVDDKPTSNTDHSPLEKTETNKHKKPTGETIPVDTMPTIAEGTVNPKENSPPTQ